MAFVVEAFKFCKFDFVAVCFCRRSEKVCGCVVYKNLLAFLRTPSQIGLSIFIINMDFRNFDPRHTGELLKYISFNQHLFTISIVLLLTVLELLFILWFYFNRHIDRQNEVLMEAYRSMFHELRKLQVFTSPLFWFSNLQFGF